MRVRWEKCPRLLEQSHDRIEYVAIMLHCTGHWRILSKRPGQGCSLNVVEDCTYESTAHYVYFQFDWLLPCKVASSPVVSDDSCRGVVGGCIWSLVQFPAAVRVFSVRRVRVFLHDMDIYV